MLELWHMRVRVQGMMPDWKYDSGNVFNEISSIENILIKMICYYVYKHAYTDIDTRSSGPA